MAEIGLATILSAVGSVVTGVATFQSARANAAISEMNADIADENARRAITRSQVEQEQQDLMTRGLLGEQVAAQAASGVNVGTGSPRFTRIAARELGRLDALNVRQAGELEGYNYRTQAAGARAQASADRRGGAFGLLSGFLGAGSAITNARPTAQRNYYAPNPTPRPRILT